MQVLENAGYTVEDKTNVSSSDVCRAALENGEFDVYWEYTGTAWLSFLGNAEIIPDAQELYDAVKEADADNGITRLDFAPMNNTYALAMKADRAEELGLTNYSELGDMLPPIPANWFWPPTMNSPYAPTDCRASSRPMAPILAKAL